MMLRGLWKLTWIEIKIFLREPLGAFGTIGIPVLVFVVTGRIVGHSLAPASLAASSFITAGLPVLASVLIAISAVLSLVTIISIYREGGHSETASRYSLAPPDDPHCPCGGQAAAHRGHAGLNGSRRQTLLSDRNSCSTVRFYDGACDKHLQHPVDGLSHRQHRSHGAFCAADRRCHHVPDDRCLGTLRAGYIAAASDPSSGQSCAANVRSLTARRHLEGRRLVGSCGRRSGTGRGVYPVHGALGEGVSLGVADISRSPRSFLQRPDGKIPTLLRHPHLQRSQGGVCEVAVAAFLLRGSSIGTCSLIAGE